MRRGNPTTGARYAVSASVFCAILLLTGVVRAREPYELPDPDPQTIEDVLSVLEEEIPAYTDGAQCGGWVSEESVGEELGDGIADVEGLPGREGLPLGDIFSGMGLKDEEGGQLDDGYQYPEDARGLSTRCPLETETLRKIIFSYSSVSWMESPEIEAPFFEDPPCMGKPEDCAEFCEEINLFGYADCYTVTGDQERGFYCSMWCYKNTCTDGWTDFCNTSLSGLTEGELEDSPQLPAREGERILYVLPDEEIPDLGLFEEEPTDEEFVPEDPTITPPSPTAPVVEEPVIEEPPPEETSFFRSLGRMLTAALTGQVFEDEFFPEEEFVPEEEFFPEEEFIPEEEFVPEEEIFEGPLFCCLANERWEEEVTGGIRFDGEFIQPGDDCAFAFDNPGFASRPATPFIEDACDEKPLWCCLAQAEEINVSEAIAFDGTEMLPDYDCKEALGPDFASRPATEEFKEACGWEVIVLTFPEPAYPNCEECEGEECRCELGPPTGNGMEGVDEEGDQTAGGLAENECDESETPECLLVVEEGDIGKPDYTNINVEDGILLQGCRNAGIDNVLNGLTVDGLGMADCEAFIDGPEQGLMPGVYSSFYRQYFASYVRRLMDFVAPQDVSENEGEVACYGFYDEFDPLTVPAGEKDRRCVMDIDVMEHPVTQAGRAQIGEPSLTEFDPNMRLDDPFSQEEDLWYPHLGGAFSLLNESVFNDEYGGDLALAILEGGSSDVANLLALTDTPASVTRAIDDTGQERSIVTWWQDQQTAMSSLFTPPVIRLLLPAKWAYGLDPSNPLFGGDPPPEPGDPRSQPVEVQVRATDEDLIGRVMAYLESSMTAQIVEEPVPVAVPLASPVRLRGIAQERCDREKQETGNDECPGEQPVVDRLLEYAELADTVRVLRAVQAETLVSVLGFQGQVSGLLDQVVEETMEKYRQFLEDRQGVFVLYDRWKEIERAYDAFGNGVNLPWCMNQRFTLPIYSLLDDWLPSREQCGDLLGNLPTVGHIPQGQDVLFDLGGFAAMAQTEIKLPILRPIQVKLDIVALTDPDLTVDDLPDFPSIEGVREAMREALGAVESLNVQVGEIDPPELEIPELIGEDRLLQISTAMDEIEEVIRLMNEEYTEFWSSFDQEHLEERQELNCIGWNLEACIHVEMDLLERLMRVAARPMALFAEDLLSGSPILRGVAAGCSAGDEACMYLNGEKKIRWRSKWVVNPPEEEETNVEEARRLVREETLPEPLGLQQRDPAFPYDGDPGDILGGYEVPPEVDLNDPEEDEDAYSPSDE